MTAAELPAGSPVAPWAAARMGPAATSSPVVVLTYAQAGGRRLNAVLSAEPALACTSGTGLLAACEQAAVAWRQAEGREGSLLSPLAAASIRSLAAAMIIAVTARAGRSRWCETANAPPSAAETFLQLFPGARFVCLHRSCRDVIYSVIRNTPWGVWGAEFAAFIAAHPNSMVTALAAYWATHAGRLLAFEKAHSSACLRVRYEDLVANPEETAGHLKDFLGLDGRGPQLPELPVDSAPGGHAPAAADGRATGPDLADADRPGCGADLPAGHIPAPLLSQVNDVLTKLAYEPLTLGTRALRELRSDDEP